MAALTEDYTISQGDNTPIKIIIYTDEDNTIPKNITGADITWVLKTDVDTEENLLEKTVGSGITISDAENGELTIEFTVDDTIDLVGTYYHECRIIDNAGQARRTTKGTVTVEDSGIV